MVRRHLAADHRFVCLSDQEIEGVETIKLANDWRGWWSKIELFRPGLFDGPVLYIDLDTFINKPIDLLFEVPGDFLMLRDFGRPSVPASGVMRWEGDYQRIYETFKMDFDWLMRSLNRNGFMGDQAFIARHVVPDFWQDVVPDGFFKSYKIGGAGEGLKETPVVCFHGDPKPWDGGGWIQHYWEGWL
jgi:hypothetical protein